MLLLPFIVGAVCAGNWVHVRTLAAMVAVVSLFLVRTPLLVLSRIAVAPIPSAGNPQRWSMYVEQAIFSLAVYGSLALLSVLYLGLTVPLAPLVLLGVGAMLIIVATLHPSLRNRQRSGLFQLLSVPALTSSSLLAYLAAAGEWDHEVLWIWLLFTVQMFVSVLVVRATMGFLMAQRSRGSNRGYFVNSRNAMLAEVLLWLLLMGVALHEEEMRWAALAFLPPSILHCWALTRLKSVRARIRMREVGLRELAASVLFSLALLFFL
jgi:hypothetical protein